MRLYIPENLNLDDLFEGICHPDYARMFLHILVTKGYKTKKNKFVHLNALLLRKQIHAKKTEIIRNKLVETGIIECDNIYVPKLKCYGYKLNSTYKRRIVSILCNNKILNKKNTPSYPVLLDPEHIAMWEWLHKIKIDYVNSLKLLKNIKNITQKTLMLEKLYHRDFFFTIDKQGRCYTNVTCLWTKFRDLLYLNGKKLKTIDIKNSQPLLFTVFIRQYYYILSTSNDAPFRYPEDVLLFIKLSQNGILYDYFLDEIDLSRKCFKKKFFAEVFYAKSGVETDLSRKFQELFPNVFKVICHFKRDDHRILPKELQRLEASLMIKGVCKRLCEEYKHIPFLTVHDSILTLPEYVEQVKMIIKDVFSKVNLFPSFGT